MNAESVGSFLPNDKLLSAKADAERGAITDGQLKAIEDEAVKAIVEKQIACGLPYVTSGELRLKHWAKDFWFGLGGVERERVDSGRVYQAIEAGADQVRLCGRIAYNPEHPFFDDFKFLHKAVGGRAMCRQALPSPANLLLEIYGMSDGEPQAIYPAPDAMAKDIAEAYRRTALMLYEMGCRSLQYDDTALGLMCDDDYTKRLLQGGVDLIKLHGEIIDVINSSLAGPPKDMETSIYISGGDKVVPEWEYIDYPDNIMPKALRSLNVDKFFLPFGNGPMYPFEVLRHVPKGKKVVLGLIDAHTPFFDDSAAVRLSVEKAKEFIPADDLLISTRTGFKLSSYSERGLTDADQWNKIEWLKTFSA